MQYSETLRNNQLNQIESTAGASAVLRMYTGAAPANCAAVATGTLLAEMTLPADWMAAAAAGSVVKAGTWEDPAANGDGTLGYFRIWDSGVTVCHIQGTITLSGGGGDMIVDNTNVLTGQNISVSVFTVNAGNA